MPSEGSVSPSYPHLCLTWLQIRSSHNPIHPIWQLAIMAHRTQGNTLVTIISLLYKRLQRIKMSYQMKTYIGYMSGRNFCPCGVWDILPSRHMEAGPSPEAFQTSAFRVSVELQFRQDWLNQWPLVINSIPSLILCPEAERWKGRDEISSYLLIEWQVPLATSSHLASVTSSA